MQVIVRSTSSSTFMFECFTARWTLLAKIASWYNFEGLPEVFLRMMPTESLKIAPTWAFCFKWVWSINKLKISLGILLKVLRNIELGDLNLFELLLRNTFIKRTDHLIDGLEAVQDWFYQNKFFKRVRICFDNHTSEIGWLESIRQNRFEKAPRILFHSSFGSAISFMYSSTCRTHKRFGRWQWLRKLEKFKWQNSIWFIKRK